MARVKCSVCGLWRGAKPHTGPMHDRIMARRKGRHGAIARTNNASRAAEARRRGVLERFGF